VAPLAGKLRRLAEAADLTLRLAADGPSRRALASCYADLGGALHDGTEMELRIRSGRSVRACRIRRSDVFTLAEIFHEQQYVVRSPVPDAPVIVDAGANVGLTSLWLAGRYPGAVLHAFEPEEENFRLLEHNLRGLEGASALRMAVGGADGEILLGISEHGAMHSTSDTTGSVRTVPVRCVRLESYMEEQAMRTVDILKLDVEGAELDVLHGLGDRIKDIGIIVGEVHERVVDVDAFYRYLSQSGFSNVMRVPFRDGDAEGVHGFEACRWPA